MTHRAWRNALSVATLMACSSCAPGFVFSYEARKGIAEPYETTDYSFADGKVPSGLRVVAYQQRNVSNLELRATWATGGIPDVQPGVRLVARNLLDQLTPGPRSLTMAHRRYALGALFWREGAIDDVTSVSIIKPSMLAEAVRIESERMVNPAGGLTEELLERTKAELVYQLERTELEPAAQAQLAFARSFPGGRVADLGLTPEQVRKINLEDVRRFLDASLRPERAVFVVSGPEGPSDTLPTMVEAFGGAPAFGVKGKDQAPYRPRVEPLPEVVPDMIQVASTGGSRRLVLSWALPGAGKDFEPAMLVARRDLRIQVPLALKSEGQGGKAIPVDVLLTQGDDYSSIQVVLDLKPDADAAKARKAVLAAIGDLGYWGDRWRGYFANSMQEARFALNKGRVPIDGVARAMRMSNEPDPEHAFVEVRRRQLSTGLKSLLADYVTPARTGVVLFVPPAGTADEQAPLEIASAFEPVQPGPSPLGVAAPGRAAILRLPLPNALDGARRERLPNGLRVVVVPFGAEPFARVTLSLPGGAAAGGENVRADAAVASLLKALPPACHRLALKVYADQAQIQMEVQSSGVRYALEAFSCLRLDLAGPIDEGEMTPLLSRSEQAWNLLRDAGQFSSNDWNAGWTGRYLRRTLSPEDAELLVVGKVDVDATLAIIRERFSSWRIPQGTALAFSKERRPHARVAVVLDMPGAKKATAIVLIPTSLVGAPGEVVAVADELASNRLERLALVNGIKGRAGHLSRSPGLEALRLRLEGNVDRVAKVLGLALEQAGAATLSPPSEPELALARWNVARAWLYADLSLHSISTQLDEVELRGDDPKSWGARGRRLAATEAEPVYSLFRNDQIGHEGILISGDEKILVPALVKLGFAPVVFPAVNKKEKR